jgi:colanic acid/amylovoran biosynthesis protein
MRSPRAATGVAVTGATPLRLCLFGAPGSNTNLGLAALMQSTLAAVERRAPGSHVTVFDHHLGVRPNTLIVDGRDAPYTLVGARLSRRLYRSESFANIRASDWLGGLRNVAARAIADADAILDLSGGDSFTDLYGEHRFRTVAVPKQIGSRKRRRLLLLPQTYGPFASERTRQLASQLVLRARAAWARDEASLDVLRELTASGFDPDRHRSGVDVAFLLPPRPLDDDSVALRWLSDGQSPLVGLNVSGLLHLDAGARRQYGLRVDYARAMFELLQRLLTKTDARVVLVPHVLGNRPDGESDNIACEQLRNSIEEPLRSRVALAPWTTDPGEAKWLISRLDWFCGTRMHSTIAALSSGVPAAAVGYSPKTAGVFATCGLADQVADGRQLETSELTDLLWWSYIEREESARRLRSTLPGVLELAEQQMDDVVRLCRED